MPCTVNIPSPLRSYTGGVASVPAEGGTLEEVLQSLEKRFTGLRFRIIDEQQRIRPHIRLYVGLRQARALSERVGAADTVHVICALSGG